MYSYSTTLFFHSLQLLYLKSCILVLYHTLSSCFLLLISCSIHILSQSIPISSHSFFSHNLPPLVLLYLHLFLFPSLSLHTLFSLWGILTPIFSSHLIFNPIFSWIQSLYSYLDQTGLIIYDNSTNHMKENITLTYRSTNFWTNSLHFDTTQILWLLLFSWIPCRLQWSLTDPLHLIPHGLHQVFLKKLLIVFHSWNLIPTRYYSRIIYQYSWRNHYLITEEIIYLYSRRNHLSHSRRNHL